MDKIYDNSVVTREGKPIKNSAFDNGAKLTDEQRKRGNLKGRVKYWSEQLRCFFYLKPNVDFAEVEQRYIDYRNNIDRLTK